MPTKKQLEAIIEGLGFDPSTPIEDYVKIGSFLFPKTSAVTLKWEGEYDEFKRDDSWYFDENSDEMRERLEAWELTYDPEYLAEFVEYGGTHWEDTRTGIQAKISKSWDSLEALMSECDPSDIALADTMMLTLPMGQVSIHELTFENAWIVDKVARASRRIRRTLGDALADFFESLSLTSTRKLGTKGVKELIDKVPSEVSFEEAERILGLLDVTSSAQTRWDAHVAEIERLEAEREAQRQSEREAEQRRQEEESERQFQEDVHRYLSSTHEMVHIPAGNFMMGALEDDEDADDAEKPRHKVTLTRDFLMGKYGVTQALWQSVMGSNPSYFKGANRPVEQVSWFDVVDFCNKLSKREGLAPAYTINGENVTCNWTANGYRLPTEAEWEYSARANESYKYSGSDNVDEVAWYSGNSGHKTHPVGLKKPNGFGLYDMSGNVWEWVWDWWSADYSTESQQDSVENPTGNPTGPGRVYRGGSWYDSPEYVRTSARSSNLPALRDDFLGFRICKFP